MTNFYLLRHGDAEPGSGIRDRERRLTPGGVGDVLRQARAHLERGERIGAILCSPYIRAQQTANLVNGLLKTSLEIVSDLTPSGNVQKVMDRLMGSEEDVLLVTHLPLVADLAEALTRTRIAFFPGTCAKINCGDPIRLDGTLVWVHHP